MPVAELEEQYKQERAKLAELGVELDEEDNEDEEKEDDEEEEEEDVLAKSVNRAKKYLITILTDLVKSESLFLLSIRSPTG